ncbi:MAG TPA: hypothetical protein VEB42_14510 [Chitinophagaceae bacterium]|nr:hypothetical protein [Chitinophagaceae bacterium]
MNKLLDLRFVIGVFFVALSVLLLGYSFFASDLLDGAKTINRICGSVFGVFGVVMVILSFQKDAHDELE